MDKVTIRHCDAAISLKIEYTDESNITLVGSIFGSIIPTLLQVNNDLFSSPVPLTGKLHFFPISSSPSQMLKNIFEKLENGVNITAMHSTWNGERGVTVLKIDSDVSDLNNVVDSNNMSLISF